MQFPLSLSDISLWLAFTAMILLITSAIISPHYGKTGVPIDNRRLRIATLIVCTLFIFTVSLQIYQIIIS